MSDDPGVMGNLPRSRPGQRSAKRAASGATAKKAAGGGKQAAGRAKATKATSARSQRSARPKAAAPRSRPARAAGEARQPQPATSGPDPLGDAVRVAAKLAGAGMGVAAGILRRLPRP